MYPNTLYQRGNFDASLPYLKHFSLVVQRPLGASTKFVAYIVKTLTADATLEELDLRCDFQGWDTLTIYRAIKRHSKTLRVLCAPGWYAHTAMLQALDKFIVLEEVTLGRFMRCEVRLLPLPTSCHSYPQVSVLRYFKRVQRVYLYNHRHAPPLPTREVKTLLLQRESKSTIETLGYTDSAGRTIDVWKVRKHYRSEIILYRIFRFIGHTTQTLIDHVGTSFGVRIGHLRVWFPISGDHTKYYFLRSRFVVSKESMIS